MIRSNRPWLTLILTAACAGGAEPAATPEGRRPNVVFILTDDQGYGDLSCHGNPILKTPNLDRLHAEGVRFTDFHVSPTCSPTRSALMTGRHEFRNGVTHTILERERLTPRATTVALWYSTDSAPNIAIHAIAAWQPPLQSCLPRVRRLLRMSVVSVLVKRVSPGFC